MMRLLLKVPSLTLFCFDIVAVVVMVGGVGEGGAAAACVYQQTGLGCRLIESDHPLREIFQPLNKAICCRSLPSPCAWFCQNS